MVGKMAVEKADKLGPNVAVEMAAMTAALRAENLDSWKVALKVSTTDA
jgi:hypothetical protein